MKFKTVTGSLYEVNTDSKQIRRLNGSENPTPRQGKDGEWRKYADTSPIKVGEKVFIRWGAEVELLEETKAWFAVSGGCAMPVTLTSHVVSIEE